MTFKCDGCDRTKSGESVRWGTNDQWIICQECLPKLKKIRENIENRLDEEPDLLKVERYDIVEALAKHIIGELIHIKSMLEEMRNLHVTQVWVPKDADIKVDPDGIIGLDYCSVNDLFPPSRKGKGSDDRLMSDAIAFAIRMEFVYLRSVYGLYDHKVANEAALAFISTHARDEIERLVVWTEKHALNLAGLINVTPDIFDYLWDTMQSTRD